MSNALSFIVMKRKAKTFWHKIHLICFHTLQKYDPNKSYTVTQGLLITPFKELEITDASVVSRLQVRASAMLL
jgi:hypothetical protein